MGKSSLSLMVERLNVPKQTFERVPYYASKPEASEPY